MHCYLLTFSLIRNSLCFLIKLLNAIFDEAIITFGGEAMAQLPIYINIDSLAIYSACHISYILTMTMAINKVSL